MDLLLKDLANMTIPIISIIGLSTFLAIASYADARKKERESHHRNEFRKALVQKWGGDNPEKLLELLQEEAKGSDTNRLLDLIRDDKPADPVRRKERLNLVGLVSTALGLGICIGFYYVGDTDFHQMWPIGLMPLFIGIALLIHSIFFVRV